MYHLFFGRMYPLFSLNKEDYLRRYHRRSNVGPGEHPGSANNHVA
jgi:hypothetical protein